MNSSGRRKGNPVGRKSPSTHKTAARTKQLLESKRLSTPRSPVTVLHGGNVRKSPVGRALDTKGRKSPSIRKEARTMSPKVRSESESTLQAAHECTPAAAPIIPHTLRQNAKIRELVHEQQQGELLRREAEIEGQQKGLLAKVKSPPQPVSSIPNNQKEDEAATELVQLSAETSDLGNAISNLSMEATNRLLLGLEQHRASLLHKTVDHKPHPQQHQQSNQQKHSQPPLLPCAQASHDHSHHYNHSHSHSHNQQQKTFQQQAPLFQLDYTDDYQLRDAMRESEADFEVRRTLMMSKLRRDASGGGALPHTKSSLSSKHAAARLSTAASTSPHLHHAIHRDCDSDVRDLNSSFLSQSASRSPGSFLPGDSHASSSGGMHPHPHASSTPNASDLDAMYMLRRSWHSGSVSTAEDADYYGGSSGGKGMTASLDRSWHHLGRTNPVCDNNHDKGRNGHPAAMGVASSVASTSAVAVVSGGGALVGGVGRLMDTKSNDGSVRSVAAQSPPALLGSRPAVRGTGGTMLPHVHTGDAGSGIVRVKLQQQQQPPPPLWDELDEPDEQQQQKQKQKQGQLAQAKDDGQWQQPPAAISGAAAAGGGNGGSATGGNAGSAATPSTCAVQAPVPQYSPRSPRYGNMGANSMAHGHNLMGLPPGAGYGYAVAGVGDSRNRNYMHMAAQYQHAYTTHGQHAHAGLTPRSEEDAFLHSPRSPFCSANTTPRTTPMTTPR